MPTKLLELAELKRDAAKDVVEIEEAPPEDEETSADVIDIMAVLKQRMGAGGSSERAGPARAAPSARGRSSVRRERVRRQEQEGALRAGQEVGSTGPQLHVARGADRGAAKSGLTSAERAPRVFEPFPWVAFTRANPARNLEHAELRRACRIGLQVVPLDRQRHGRIAEHSRARFRGKGAIVPPRRDCPPAPRPEPAPASGRAAADRRACRSPPCRAGARRRSGRAASSSL